MSSKYASIREPPAHIIADGSRVFLPPPSAQEKAFFFSRSVVKHNLLESDKSGRINEKLDMNDEDDDSQIDDSNYVHPLAKASAVIEANGISELSKAINLSSLVHIGEYFTLENIVDSSWIAEKSDKTSVVRSASRTSVRHVSSAVISDGDKVIHEEDLKLRSNFVLKRKQKQFFDAKEVLYQHHKRLKVSCNAQRVIDRRLIELRGKWRIAVPEHPSIPIPVRPDEVVCIDVDIYSENQIGEKSENISKKVPKYATIELSDDFDVTTEFKRRKDGHKMTEYERHHADIVEPRTDILSKEGTKSPGEPSVDEWPPVKCVTKAVPFVVPDPILRNVEFEFDPDNIPILTLKIHIEESSTGFLHTVALDPFSDHSNLAYESELKSDDAVLQSLQHSLFCAKIFDMIRHELNPSTTHNHTRKHASHDDHQNVHHNVQVPPAWLPADMDENFLPASELMSSNRSISSLYGYLITHPLSVIYCHHGEVKVQLNSEYALIVKLEDVNQAVDISEETSQVGSIENLGSGTKPNEKLDLLCHILLLHVQSVFHHNKKLSEIQEILLSKMESKNKKVLVDYSVGTPSDSFAKSKKTLSKDPYPILQSTVALGLKSLLEQDVLSILKVRQYRICHHYFVLFFPLTIIRF